MVSFIKLKKNNLNIEKGFTLIELIMVIVVLSVLALGSVQFISYSALGYVDTARRSELASTAIILNEKMSRLVRDALPGSVRISSDKRCLEFIPIVAGTQYIQAPIVGSPVSQTQVHAVPLDGALAQMGYLAIYPQASDINIIYSDTINPGYISNEMAVVTATVNNASVFTFNNSATFQFLLNSPTQRLFIVSSPVAFCQEGTSLFYYRNYGFVGDISNLAAGLPNSVPNRLLVANQLLANSIQFSYLPSSLRRNAIVAYELSLIKNTSSEHLVVNQEVQIRNVP